jgi:shikimate 5-dehydrogenase
MLLHQGARALELWTGQNPPIEVMREALRRNVYGE